jgi:molybdopterin synthase catalytic subunit/molybdopterin converting factor small subunit
MHVRVVPFGVLKDWLGSSGREVELREGATVAELLKTIGTDGSSAEHLSGIAVGVNAEYATAGQVLRDGDEVALLPPVSGGAPRTADALPRGGADHIALTREEIAADRLVAAAKQGEDGAVVVFDGIVRNNSRSRRTLYLDYEAYEEMAIKQMRELAEEARSRFAIRQVTIVHRLGRLEIGETSVLIVVASAHRAPAFEANRWLIDTLKQTVPIWKKEVFVDGAVWAAGEPFPAPFALAPEGSRGGGDQA